MSHVVSRVGHLTILHTLFRWCLSFRPRTAFVAVISPSTIPSASDSSYCLQLLHSYVIQESLCRDSKIPWSGRNLAEGFESD